MLKTKLSKPILLISSAIVLITLAFLLLFPRLVNPAHTAPKQPETGWKTQGTSKYYILPNGSAASGLQKIDGKTYYFRSSGSMFTGWKNLNGNSYYFLENGQGASGTLTIDGTVHHFTEGGIASTGWYEHEGKNIYLDRTGVACTGWQTIDGISYYFDENGFPCSGWFEQDGKTYYLNEDGSVARGRCVIDDIAHYFASNGEELILANPWNYIPDDYTVNLKKIDANHQVAEEAYPDLEQMLTDCKAAGCAPVVCSSYRTQEYQEFLYNRKINRLLYAGLSKEEAQKQAGTVVAVPGTSEHQLGLALDIIDNSNWNLDQSQEKTKTQQWLMEHSWEYGWILRYPNGKTEITGIIYEPWHYRYVGKEIAAELHDLDMCLEEYLQMLTDAVG